mmetsp:Transcript_24287/g.70928  ORF Transcript_24287/g.70928 Transcript_24287/m.70928 type:complete len:202 (+) Transcript_24287:308-913(+)
MAERVSESRLAPGRGTRRPPSVAVAPRRQPAFFGEWPRAACFGSGRGSGERRAHTEGHVSRRGVAVVWPRCGSHERSARERDRGAGAGGDEGGARAHGELCVGARRETAGAGREKFWRCCGDLGDVRVELGGGRKPRLSRRRRGHLYLSRSRHETLTTSNTITASPARPGEDPLFRSHGSRHIWGRGGGAAGGGVTHAPPA